MFPFEALYLIELCVLKCHNVIMPIKHVDSDTYDTVILSTVPFHCLWIISVYLSVEYYFSHVAYERAFSIDIPLVTITYALK